MQYKDKIKDYLEKGNGTITAQYCREEGIPTIYLTRLVEEGELVRADRGIYVTKDGDYDELFFLQHKYKKIIFSYETALYLHRKTDKIPQIIEVTVPYSYKINDVPKNLKIHYVKKNIVNIGISTVSTIFGNKVVAYDMERIVCDFIQNKKDIDPEVYVKTIKDYASSRTSDINKLFKYANKMGITEKVRTTMEVIYE